MADGPNDDVVEHLFSSRHPDVIDLSIGAPGDDLLSALPGMFTEGTIRGMQQRSAGAYFQYGSEQGGKVFRRNLASFLSDEYNDTVKEDELILTTGATNGLFLAATLLLDRQAVVFVENPTYFLALNVLVDDLGLQAVPVLLNKDGVDTVALEKLVVEARKKFTRKTKRMWSMFYCIPNYHNPTGVTYSLARCKEVLRIAEENDMLVFCDDVYNMLWYNNRPPFSRLKSLDVSGKVISNGTFSKILGPGLRMGWLEVPRNLLERFTNSGVLLSGGCKNNYLSGVVASLLHTGHVAANLKTLRAVFEDRMSSAHAYLLDHLPSGWTVLNPHGGYFLWIEATVDITQFCSVLERDGVNVLHGPKACPYTHLGASVEGNLSNCCRISIAHFPKERILEACRILCSEARKTFC